MRSTNIMILSFYSKCGNDRSVVSHFSRNFFLNFRALEKALKMAMWADNVKFVKDIIDSKYQKIDSAIAEVSYGKRMMC